MGSDFSSILRNLESVAVETAILHMLLGDPAVAFSKDYPLLKANMVSVCVLFKAGAVTSCPKDKLTTMVLKFVDYFLDIIVAAFKSKFSDETGLINARRAAVALAPCQELFGDRINKAISNSLQECGIQDMYKELDQVLAQNSSEMFNKDAEKYIQGLEAQMLTQGCFASSKFQVEVLDSKHRGKKILDAATKLLQSVGTFSVPLSSLLSELKCNETYNMVNRVLKRAGETSNLWNAQSSLLQLKLGNLEKQVFDEAARQKLLDELKAELASCLGDLKSAGQPCSAKVVEIMETTIQIAVMPIKPTSGGKQPQQLVPKVLPPPPSKAKAEAVEPPAKKQKK